MASTYGIKKIAFIVFFSFSLVILISYSKSLSSKNQPDKSVKYDFLENGDLVCRLGKGYFSNIFKEYASKDKLYSHIGIIINKKNTLYVIHSEASELTGVGGIKIEKLSEFLNEIDEFSFYRLKVDSIKKIKIVTKSKYYLENKLKFDLDFNSFDDNEMYCTEFIAKCINYGLEKEIVRPTVKLNSKLYYGLDDMYKNKIITKLNY